MKNRTAHTPDLLRRRLLQLSALVEENARRCVLAIRARDWQAAQRVIDEDDEVDALEISIEEDCVVQLQSGTLVQTERLIHLLSISRYLERIADYATNIAENVVYMTEGRIIRHSGNTARSADSCSDRK